MISTYHLKHWLKYSNSSIASVLYRTLKTIAKGNIPLPILPYKLFRFLYRFVRNTISELARLFWWTPLFKSQLKAPPKSLFLYSGMPFTNDALDITLGEHCRISGQTTFTGRHQESIHKAQLKIGNNVGISWQTTIAVANEVVLEDNVRIAGRCFLAGYPGHPINPADRAAGLPDDASQVGPITLERDVWLGTGCTVLAGVKIGQASIIGAGSIVTKNIPPGVLAAGNPARVIRTLSQNELYGKAV